MNKRRFTRAQSNIVVIVLLVSTVVVMGVGLTTYAVSHLNNMRSLVELKETLRSETVNTVVYEEFRNSTHVCLGIIRLLPEYRLYYYFVTIERGVKDKSIANVEYESTYVSPNRVYIMDADYTPMSAFLVRNIPLGKIVFNPAERQPLVCLRVQGIGSSQGQVVVVYFSVELGGNFYEVARWYI